MVNIRHTEEAQQFLESTIFPITRLYGLPDALVASQWAVEGGGIKDNPQHNLFGLGGVEHFMSFPTLKDGVEYYAKTVIKILNDKGYDITQMKDDPVAIVQALQDPKGSRYEGHNPDPNTYVWTVTNTPEWRENGGTEYSPRATSTPTTTPTSFPQRPTATPTLNPYEMIPRVNVRTGERDTAPRYPEEYKKAEFMKRLKREQKQPLPQRFIDYMNPFRRVEAQGTTMLPTQPYDTGRGMRIPQASYTVQKGDTLWGIAQRYLGSGQRYGELQGYKGKPTELPIGQKITINQPTSMGGYQPKVSEMRIANNLTSPMARGVPTPYVPPKSQPSQYIYRGLEPTPKPTPKQPQPKSTRQLDPIKTILNAITNLFKSSSKGNSFRIRA